MADAGGQISLDLPEDGAAPDLDELRRKAQECRACDLWQTGTQTVFGEGPSADVMLVGGAPEVTRTRPKVRERRPKVRDEWVRKTDCRFSLA